MLLGLFDGLLERDLLPLYAYDLLSIILPSLESVVILLSALLDPFRGRGVVKIGYFYTHV